MASLGVSIALLLSGFVAWIFWQHAGLNQLQTVARQPLVSYRSPVLCSVVLLAMTLVIYGQTGRYSDWNKGKIDEHIDYLVAADITKALRQVDAEPQNPLALMALAQAYSAGGKYGDSVQTLDKLLALTPEDAEVLGTKANAMYYRDGRQLTPETLDVIAKALAMSPFDPQTKMLLATDAYLHKRYQEAIEHWQSLLTQSSGRVNRNAINNAIQKAQIKLNESGY